MSAIPLAFLLGAPDFPFEPATHAAIDTAIGEIATARAAANQAAFAPAGPQIIWLGPPPRDEFFTARKNRREQWRILPIGVGAESLPQPPGPIADVVVLGFALTSGARPEAVPGFALRALRDADRTGRVVILDRVRGDLGPFITSLDAWAGEATLDFRERLRWFDGWSRFTLADLCWLLPYFGIGVYDGGTECGTGRKFAIARACPMTQISADDE